VRRLTLRLITFPFALRSSVRLRTLALDFAHPPAAGHVKTTSDFKWKRHHASPLLLAIWRFHLVHIIHPADHLRDQAANRAEISPHLALHGPSGQLGHSSIQQCHCSSQQCASSTRRELGGYHRDIHGKNFRQIIIAIVLGPGV
jgi:hypothetical protein